MATTPPPGVPSSLQADLPDPSSSPSSPSQKPTVFDAVKTINPVQDLQRLPSMPCARTSLLFGIVAGASIGGLRFIFSRGGRGTLAGGNNRWGEMGAAANWAVGAWGIGSLGAWETCRARQTAEATRMAALVSEIKSRQAAKAAKQRTTSPSIGSATPSPSGSEGNHTRAGPVGGIMLGARGKEMIRERQDKEGGRESTPPSKGDTSWLGGRI
ncbi:hypothetical protein JCM16303_001000 [Sporobolomyces ruberrimus]